MGLDGADKRDVDVVVSELVQAEDLLSEGIVSVKGGEGLVDCFDQAGIDALGNVVAVEGAVQCGIEAADSGVEDILLDRTCIKCGDGLLVGLVCAVELLVGTSSDLPVPSPAI